MFDKVKDLVRVACQKTHMIPSGVSQKEYARLKTFYADEATNAIIGRLVEELQEYNQKFPDAHFDEAVWYLKGVKARNRSNREGE